MRLCVLCLAALALTGPAPVAVAADNQGYVRNVFTTDLPVRRLTAWFDNQPENVLITIEVLTSPPPQPPQLSVYAYLIIDAQGLATRAEVEFKIPRLWLEQNYVNENSAVLLRLDNSWSELPTQLTEPGETLTYVAQTAGLSTFAIAGRPSGQPPTAAGVLILISGIIAASLIYWFLIRPRRMFVSVKKLKKDVGTETAPPPPGAEKNMAAAVKRLREAAAPGLPQAKVEKLRTAPGKKGSYRGDVVKLKRLKKKTIGGEKGGKQS
ncbi:MAG: PGF-pre-PGF domain-containing protein [Candidatus Hadarchaeota archaeon]